ncbi:MAG: hypothetical protein GY757_55435 [bacterium]|nr:hypothetical protein [bacterium]
MMKKIFIAVILGILAFTWLWASVPPAGDGAPQSHSELHSHKNHHLSNLSEEQARKFHPREGLINYTFAIILTFIGVVSIVLNLFFLKTRDRALLFFGLFTFLYGIRIHADNFFFNTAWGNELLWCYISTFSTYLIPVAMILFFKQFTGWGVKYSIGWLLSLQGLFAVAAISHDIITVNPGIVMYPFSHMMTIAVVLVIWINIYALSGHTGRGIPGHTGRDKPGHTGRDKPGHPEMKLLQTLFPLAALIIINGALTALQWVPWSFSSETVFVSALVFILGFIAARRLFDRYKQIREHLMQADKLIAIGTLVSGVAHEINNPNNFILLNSQILTKTWKDAEPALAEYNSRHEGFRMAGVSYAEARENIPKFIADIHDGALRIKNIVASLKDYARPGSLEKKEPVDLKRVVESAVKLIRNQVKKHTDNFETQLSDTLPPVTGNFQQLEQVVVNLLLNSLQALPHRSGTVRVAVFYAEDKQMVCLRVFDEGAGIAPAHLDQLTNPFFTTRRETGGLGMGLSISATIVKEHGGTIGFHSPKNSGTTVTVYLPAGKK